MQFKLSSWHVNTEENTLSDTNTHEQYHIEPRTMDVLLLLINNAEKVVTRQTFLSEVWGDTVVVEEALSRCISELRKTLGDNAKSPTFIQTVHKKGYKLLISPTPLGEASLDTAPLDIASSDIDENSNQPAQSSTAIKNKKPKLIGAIVAALVVAVAFMVYQTLPSSSRTDLTEQFNPEEANTFITSDLETLKQNLLQLTSERVLITLTSNPEKLLTYTVLSEKSEAQTKDTTNFVIQDNDQQTLWELTRNVATPVEKTKALDDVLLILNSMQTSYLYQVKKNLPDDIQQKYQQAMYNVDKRGAENLDKAIVLFDEVIDYAPDFVEAIINKAAAIRNLNFYRPDLEMRKQRMIEFNLLLKQAASIDPTHPLVKAVNARFDIKKKNWQEYEQTLLNAVKQVPSCYLCVRFLAEFYVNVGYFEKAANSIEDNLNYFPLSRQMHALLGEIYTKQGNIIKAQEQADILKALGSETATDSLAIGINIHSQLDDTETVGKLLKQFVEKHPNIEFRLRIFEATVAGDYEAMRRIINDLPYLDFNLGLSAGKIDAVYERMVNNVTKGNIRDLGLMHGWLHGPTNVQKFYSGSLLALKNHADMEDFLLSIGIIDFWEENGQWPDYCEQDKYLELRPNFCPSASRIIDVANNN